MALREDQIVRYGRQILLKEVGGRGQEKLLSAPVRVRGVGPAFDDAIAWLVAGGSPVEVQPQRAVGGFLGGAPLAALNPDATPAGAPAIELLPPELASTSGAQVVLGQGLAFRGHEGCEACWILALAELRPGPPPAPLGSLAALVVQRLLLGLEPSVGLLAWSGERFERHDRRCPRH